MFGIIGHSIQVVKMKAVKLCTEGITELLVIDPAKDIVIGPAKDLVIGTMEVTVK